MTPEQYEQVRNIFLRLREVASASQRAEELAAIEDAEMADEVATLLAADADCEGFLEPRRSSSASAAAPPATEPTESATALTTVTADAAKSLPWIGRYRLLQQIGEGGYGTVYMAQQSTPVERKVAVKLIKLGMDSKLVLSRFHAERQALAIMEHPSIAKVLDAGTTETGAPYFVMELVKGAPINAFCETHGLGLGERLRLFVQVCRAVHHAHQKGVIHRDIKPSNVLVTMNEGEPLAKVIDFGIAKALDRRLTERTLFTEYGQLLGTLEYMSPEQAEMSSLDIDTRSDVYSLGVLLYQLLTGETPLSKEHLLRDGIWEVHRRLRESEPPTPSTRVTQSHHPAVGRGETTTPCGVGNLPRGDLDWITMKALAKDRRRRYDSANDLARDVERYLAGEPVEAHPPSAWYQLSMFWKRRRVMAATTALVSMSVLVGLFVAVWGLRQARTARDDALQFGNQAESARQDAEESARELADGMYSEMVNSAWRAARGNDFARARNLLDACPARLRGWEWSFAHHQLDARRPPLRASDQSAVVELDVHEPAGIAACVLEGGDVEIRGIHRNELRHTISGPYRANSVRFTSDGKSLFVGTIEGPLTRWRTLDWQQAAEKQLLQGGIYDIQTSADSRRVAVCTGGAWVDVLDSNSLTSIGQWNLPGRVSNLVIDEAGETIVGSGLDGEIYVVNVGQEDFRHWPIVQGSLQHIAWLDADHVALLAAGTAMSVNIRDPGDPPHELIQIPGTASALAVADDGKAIAVGCGDGRFYVAEPNSISPREIAKHAAAIRAVRWLSDRRVYLLALADGRLVTADAAETPTGWKARSRGEVTAGLLLPGRGLAVAADGSGWLRCWDIQDGRLIKETRAHGDAVWSLAADADERLLATVGEDFTLACWELPSLRREFSANIDWGVRDVCLSPDGAWIAAAPPAAAIRGQQEGVIGLWNTTTGECDHRLTGHANWVTRLAVAPDGRRLVSGSVNRVTRVWDVEKAALQFELAAPKQSTAEHYSIDGRSQQLFIGHRDGQITVWSLRDGTFRASITAFGDSLSGLAITDDDRLIAASRSDPNLKVWDVGSRKPLAMFDLGLGYLADFQLSQDGRYAFFATEEAVFVQPTGR